MLSIHWVEFFYVLYIKVVPKNIPDHGLFTSYCHWCFKIFTLTEISFNSLKKQIKLPTKTCCHITSIWNKRKRSVHVSLSVYQIIVTLNNVFCIISFPHRLFINSISGMAGSLVFLAICIFSYSNVLLSCSTFTSDKTHYKIDAMVTTQQRLLNNTWMKRGPDWSSGAKCSVQHKWMKLHEDKVQVRLQLVQQQQQTPGGGLRWSRRLTACG